MANGNGSASKILTSVAVSVAIAIAGWSLKNTIDLKVDVAVLKVQIQNITKLLEDHTSAQPMAMAVDGFIGE